VCAFLKVDPEGTWAELLTAGIVFLVGGLKELVDVPAVTHDLGVASSDEGAPRVTLLGRGGGEEALDIALPLPWLGIFLLCPALAAVLLLDGVNHRNLVDALATDASPMVPCLDVPRHEEGELCRAVPESFFLPGLFELVRKLDTRAPSALLGDATRPVMPKSLLLAEFWEGDVFLRGEFDPSFLPIVVGMPCLLLLAK
jgi:hypothetical protein